MTDQSDKPKLGTRPPLGLKRTVETGKVKQSFSHGRSNTVVVEVKKRRILGRPGEAPPAEAPKPAPAAEAPKPAPKPAAPAPQPKRTSPVDDIAARKEMQARLLREAEEARLAALEEARRRDERARHVQTEEERRRAEENRKAEEAAAEEARLQAEEEARRAAEAAAAPAPEPEVVEEEEEDREVVRSQVPERVDVLTDRPEQAGWLAPDDRRWLADTMAKEGAVRARVGHTSLGQSLASRRLWLLCAVFFLNTVVNYGMFLWLPKLLEDVTGATGLALSAMTAGPFAAALAAMVIVGRHSDRTGDRRLHVSACAGITAIGLLLAAAVGFENFASGIGGVVVVAYFSALCNLQFTASQYALISAAASIVGRLLTGTTAGALVEAFGFVNFYWLTTVAALPGIILFWLMMRSGLVDSSIGTAGVVGEGDARADEPQSAGPQYRRVGAERSGTP